MKLKVVAFNRASDFSVVPFLAHGPKDLISTGPDAPNTAAGMAFRIVVPENEEYVRGVDGAPAVRGLYVGAVYQVGALLPFSAIDPCEKADENL